jgi:PKD repeat protein
MKIPVLFAFIVLNVSLSAQGVLIGDSVAPHPSSILELKSPNKGLLLPRLTTGARDSIQSPAIGLEIYNTTTHCIEAYFSNGWGVVACECTAPPATPGSILGATLNCPGADSIGYSVLPVAGASGYVWTLPGGATLVSGLNTDSVLVTFGNSGGTIQVTAQNACGQSAPQSLLVTVALPTATFSLLPASPSINSSVVFSPSVTGQGSTYAWVFSSGTPATSTAQNPSVQWSQAGNYWATLSVTSSAGCVASDSVQITVSNCPPFGGNTATFNYTGSVQTWTVPACVNLVQIECYGAQGGPGDGGTFADDGGYGGYAKGNLSVSPGQVLYIYVGEKPASATNGPGGWNGGGGDGQYGGGGGGASDVRTNGQTLNNRVIVGGGGGGGNSGSPDHGFGGAGGGNAGSPGINGPGNGACPGQGGTQSAGGAAGCGGGAAGSFGQGGSSQGAYHVGGGGGGWYGGGSAYAVGGGGGSGYIGGVSSGTMQSGQRQGHGQVVLTY